jgi:hypothetical protein
MLELQRNMSPPLRRRGPKQKYPFDMMTRVGDFFFVEGKTRNSIRTYFYGEGRKRGMRLRSELIHARQVDGKWVECQATDEGAVSGVGVWRME